MRPRRDPKPPRPPRVITTRLVVVALVVGVVLAVGSVPLADTAFEHAWPGWDDHAVDWWFEQGGDAAYVSQRTTWSGERWWVSSGPADDSAMRGLRRLNGDAPVTQTDPRPRTLRWPLEPRRNQGHLVRVGWPLRSASRGRIEGGIFRPPDQWGAPNAKVFGSKFSLSTRPIWFGLLGNTLFYAVLVLAPIALWRWRTLRRRARRGLCVACGYELGEGVGACPACPECGLVKRAF